MERRERDLGVLMASLDQFEHWRHRGVDHIKIRLDNGESLSESEIQFLETCLAELKSVLGVVERNPDFHRFAEQLLEYLHGLTDLALYNEGQSRH